MATYDAHATISHEPLIPIDVWGWMSVTVRASLYQRPLPLTHHPLLRLSGKSRNPEAESQHGWTVVTGFRLSPERRKLTP